MAYTNLVTYQDVLRRAMESSATIEAQQAEVERVIRDVTALIQSYLNRRLIAYTHTQRVLPGEFEYDPIAGEDTFWADAWPVVEVLTDGYDRLTDRRIEGEADAVAVDYVAGYRRSGQTLGQLQQNNPNATVHPDVLPADITRTALRLVIAEVSEVSDDLLGIGQKEVSIGRDVTTYQGADAGFVQRELSRLDRYRRRI